MKTALPLLLPVLATMSLAACSRDTTAYPSLAVRPTEKVGFAEPPAPPPEPIRADPALDARVADIGARLATVTAGFDRDAARAETLARAAKGRAAGSDPWLEAQTALAVLDDARAQTTGLAGEASDLATARAAELAAAYPSLDALQARIAAEGMRQSATIDRLQGGLAR